MAIPAPETVTLTILGDAGRVGASATLRRTYSLALAQAGLPFLLAARVDAAGDKAATLVLDGPDLQWTVPPSGTTVSSPAPAAWHGALEGLAGTHTRTVRLSHADGVARAEVFLTDPWWWNWRSGDLGALPALVLPQDGVVRQLAFAARRRVGDEAPTAAEAVFDLLRHDYEIAWQPPSLEHMPGGAALQPIRAPHRVVFDLHQRRGEATCIDLTLLLAGCLEAVGQAPVLIVVPDDRERPSHALLGWWRDGAQRYRPLLTAADMLTAARRGEFVALETTRLCCDRAATLGEAAAEALATLEQAPGSLGIDVRAARPPIGRVRPLGPFSDPAVLAALAAAEVAAHVAGSLVIETLHLLFGLVGQAGPLGLRLLAEAGVNADELSSACQTEIAKRRRLDHAGRTRGVIRCLDDAQHNARSQGGTVIRESDLWWAVLSLPGSSLHDLFASRPGWRPALLSALACIAPLPRHGSSLQ